MNLARGRCFDACHIVQKVEKRPLDCARTPVSLSVGTRSVPMRFSLRSGQADPPPLASRARLLFKGRYARLAWGVRNYDVSPDGQRFLMPETIGRGDPHRIVLVQNWDREVQRLVPPLTPRLPGT